MSPTRYVLAIYIADRPYKLREGFALELLQTVRYNLEKTSPHSNYKIMSSKQFREERNQAIEQLAKRDL